LLKSLNYLLEQKGDLDGVICDHRERSERIDEGKVKKWAIEIVEGLDFLHSKQVVHFDIKPANILLEQLDRVKIGDLGLARNISDIKEMRGFTPCYASPQIINSENINEKTDIW
jgi:serine/threonine protein kinase